MIPSMKDYPAITPPVITELDKDEKAFMPYKRDTERLARRWAMPGTPGLEHRIGGLEKDFLKGSVSHNPQNHQRMVDIRAEKVAKVVDFIPRQEVLGAEEGDLLVVGWGGTRGHLASTVEHLQKEGKKVSLCHINYINPLPHGLGDIFKRFKKIIVCELNEGQMANYLRMSFQEFKYEQFNKVQGLPFTKEELEDRFNELLKEK
jgi:2-oxoglutarate ferredoxin oxidoreductase subunit alpha